MKRILNYLQADPIRGFAATAIIFSVTAPFVIKIGGSLPFLAALLGLLLLLLSRFPEQADEYKKYLFIDSGYSDVGSEDHSQNFIVATRNPNYALIQIWSEALRNSGIPTEIRDEFMGSIIYKYSFAAGQIKLLVPVDRLDSALSILNVKANATFTQDSEAEPISVCPNCSSNNLLYAGSIHPLMIWTLVTLNIGYPFTKKNNRCLDCGQTWAAHSA